MECPNDKTPLEKVLFHNVEVDYCPRCLGVWFDSGELQYAKDDSDEQLNWVDIDLWRDKGRFKLSRSQQQCPSCRAGLVEVRYDKSHVKVNFCKNCQGIWLNRGEFHQIMVYLKNKSDYEVLHHYVKNLVVQLWEVFSGPKKFREELHDFLMLLKLLNYKFVVQHPIVEKLAEDLPK